jgi:tetratricopeptide (TPR) repeat protein
MFHCVRRWDQDSLSGAGLRGAGQARIDALGTSVADIFVSYTSSDQEWAFWIGQELEKLGHAAHLHDWEISGGGNIMAWMDERHDKADQVLCVVSGQYLQQPYSALERHGAQWAAVSKRPNFLLPVFIESCEAPPLLAPLKRCDLYGLTEEETRGRLATFMKPASKPTEPVPFPGVAKPAAVTPLVPVAFPGGKRALSNIPISVPRYFLGRDELLAKIKFALASDQGRVAITALHGLRGVGKSTLAVAFADQNAGNYRATWWIRAETESTMRADLVGLGVRLGWIAGDVKEEPSLVAVLERLRDDGNGLLLVYDNANSAEEIRKYLPRGGAGQIIVTSNAPGWRGIASPVEIEVWSKETGADFLSARAGRDGERDAALALSEALGGLPLAHEQAAAYCERLGISFADYLKRFEADPAKVFSAQNDAPYDYGKTVTTTFALAIDEAAKLHIGAEPLIVYAALLASEPIPLYLFSEAREKFGEPLLSALADDGLDEAVTALRSFALVDREAIPDEYDRSIVTDCIRLHRLVRQVAASRRVGDSLESARQSLIEALVAIYPSGIFNNSQTWPRVRRLDAHAMVLVGRNDIYPKGSELSAAILLDKLDAYRDGALAAYAEARSLSERALALREKMLGPDHPDTASSLNNLASVVARLGDKDASRALSERSLAIREKLLGPHHPDTATSLNTLGYLLIGCGDVAGARPLFERALEIRERVLGEDHPETARTLNNLGYVLQREGDLAGSRLLCERALAIRIKLFGSDDANLAYSFNNLGSLLVHEGDFKGALYHFERALVINVKALGPVHPLTRTAAANNAFVLDKLSRNDEALALRAKFSI